MSGDTAVVLEASASGTAPARGRSWRVTRSRCAWRTVSFVALTGPSGSGKSTLLNLIAGLDTPDDGRVEVGGRDLAHLSDDARSDLRLQRIGFVFQSFNLFPTFTVEENVAWPLEFLGVGWRRARERAAEALAQVGLGVGRRAAGRPSSPAESSSGSPSRGRW